VFYPRVSSPVVFKVVFLGTAESRHVSLQISFCEKTAWTEGAFAKVNVDFAFFFFH
jgi:hypothetical protein